MEFQQFLTLTAIIPDGPNDEVGIKFQYTVNDVRQVDDISKTFDGFLAEAGLVAALPYFESVFREKGIKYKCKVVGNEFSPTYYKYKFWYNYYRLLCRLMGMEKYKEYVEVKNDD